MTFKGGVGQESFILLKSTKPIVLYKEHYYPAFEVFPYIEIIDWQRGYMVADGRVIPSLEAPQCIRMMSWCYEGTVILTNLN